MNNTPEEKSSPQHDRPSTRSKRKEVPNDYGTGIPVFVVDALARILLPEIQAFFESEEGQREYAASKAQQREKENQG